VSTPQPPPQGQPTDAAERRVEQKSAATPQRKKRRDARWALPEGFADAVITGLLGAAVVLILWKREAIFAPDDGWLDGHLFWVLAMIPSLIGIANFWVAVRRRHKHGVEELEARRQEIADVGTDGRQRAVIDRIDASVADERKPRFSSTMLGAFVLAVVFGLAAQLSTRPRHPETPEIYGIGPALEDASRAEEPAAPGAAAPPEADRDDARAPAKPPDPNADRKGMREAIVGLVFAAYGAYAYVLRAMVGRLNALALTGRFLVRLSLQSAGTVVIGFVIGYVGAVGVVASEHQSMFVYFLIGLFPAWAAQLLAARTREIFVTKEAGCERLPLCLVDGIDDDVADRLSEENIWDIQHLATACPTDLTLRTGYSLDRILDWIDQAILITYARDDIAQFRLLGVRGAIDLAVLAPGNIAADLASPPSTPCDAPAASTAIATPAPSTPSPDPQQDAASEAALAPQTPAAAAMRKQAAEEVFRLITELTKLKKPELLAQALCEDAAVDRVWRLWQRERR
jgi:hypothetical protein